MKPLAAALLLCAVCAPAPARAAQGLEELKLSGERLFFTAQVPFLEGLLPQFPQDFFSDPKPRPALPEETGGPLVGTLSLPDQLDRHRALLALKLGPSPWDVGLVGDASHQNVYLALQQGERLLFRPLGNCNRIHSKGINVEIEPGVNYHLRTALGWPLMRGSTVRLSPIGVAGDSYRIKAGQIMDAMKARAYVFDSGDSEYWLLYETDVDPATNEPAQTRSLLFVHEDGLGSEGWPLGESEIPVGQPTLLSLGGEKLVLERNASGALDIRAVP